MSESNRKDFPDWDTLYKSQRVETMPWYNENFDFDLEKELDERKIIDNTEAVINRARKIYSNEENVNFIVDDILNSKFKDDDFDYIFDRGCFHVLLPAHRKKYISKIKQILKKDNGILFLKCFSDKEPRQEGPYKFSPEQIRDLFDESFRIDSIKETVYQGTLDPFPKGLFIVMINR